MPRKMTSELEHVTKKDYEVKMFHENNDFAVKTCQEKMAPELKHVTEKNDA